MWYVVVGDRVIPVPYERDEDANFLNKDWWTTAAPEDIEIEIKKGADVNAHEKAPRLLSEKELEEYQNQKANFGDNCGDDSPDFPIINSLKKLNECQEIIGINSLNTPILNALDRGFDDADKVSQIKKDLLVFGQDEQLSEETIKFAAQKFNCPETLEDVQAIREKLIKQLEMAKERQKMSEDIIRILVKHGASTDEVVRLHFNNLTSERGLNILDILIKGGLDINEPIYAFKKDRMINWAARYGKKEAIKKLLEAGAKDTRTFIEKIKTRIG